MQSPRKLGPTRILAPFWATPQASLNQCWYNGHAVNTHVLCVQRGAEADFRFEQDVCSQLAPLFPGNLGAKRTASSPTFVLLFALVLVLCSQGFLPLRYREGNPVTTASPVVPSSAQRPFSLHVLFNSAKGKAESLLHTRAPWSSWLV